MDLSQSLGIAPELAGYESDYDNNADGWYDLGGTTLRSRMAVGDAGRWRHLLKTSYRCVGSYFCYSAKRRVLMYSE